MKTIYRIAFFAAFVTILSRSLIAQSIDRQVISSAGDYSDNGSIKVSWTLGEPVIETFTNGNITLTQGFQQPDDEGCPTVQNPSVSNIECTSALYSWDAIDGVDHFVIQGNFSDRPIDGGSVTINDGTATSYQENNLIAGAEFHWRIIAYCDAAETEFGEWSDIIIYSTTCPAQSTITTTNIGPDDTLP